jgi:hypothetical protein
VVEAEIGMSNGTDVDASHRQLAVNSSEMPAPTWSPTIGDITLRPISTFVTFVSRQFSFSHLSSNGTTDSSGASLSSSLGSVPWASLDPFLPPHRVSLRGFIFRGQLLTLVLAGCIISLILLRDWVAGHNWAQHDRPTLEKEEEINPDEWVVTGGRSRRMQMTEQAKGRRVRPDGTIVLSREASQVPQTDQQPDENGIAPAFRDLRGDFRGGTDLNAEDLDGLEVFANNSPPGQGGTPTASPTADASSSRNPPISDQTTEMSVAEDDSASSSVNAPSIARTRPTSPEEIQDVGEFAARLPGSPEAVRTPGRMPLAKAVMWSAPELLDGGERREGKGKEKEIMVDGETNKAESAPIVKDERDVAGPAPVTRDGPSGCGEDEKVEEGSPGLANISRKDITEKSDNAQTGLASSGSRPPTAEQTFHHTQANQEDSDTGMSKETCREASPVCVPVSYVLKVGQDESDRIYFRNGLDEDEVANSIQALNADDDGQPPGLGASAHLGAVGDLGGMGDLGEGAWEDMENDMGADAEEVEEDGMGHGEAEEAVQPEQERPARQAEIEVVEGDDFVDEVVWEREDWDGVLEGEFIRWAGCV